jgi:hypothetical protein
MDYTRNVINPQMNKIKEHFYKKPNLINKDGWKPMPYTYSGKYKKPRMHTNYRIISHNPHKDELKTILSQQILKMNHLNQPPGSSVIQIAPSNVKLFHSKLPKFTYTDFPFFDLFFKEEQNAKDLSTYMKHSYYNENPIDHMMENIKYIIPKHQVRTRSKKYIKYTKVEPTKMKTFTKLSAPTDLKPFAFQSQFPKIQEEYNTAFNSFVDNNYNSIANKNFGSVSVGRPLQLNLESIQNYTHQNNSQVQSSSNNIKHTNFNVENKLNNISKNKFKPSPMFNIHDIQSNPNFKINGYSSFVTPNLNISYKYETPLNNINNTHSILKPTYIQNTPIVHVPIYNHQKQTEKVVFTPQFSPHLQIELPQNVQTLHNIPQSVPNTENIATEFDNQAGTRINLHIPDNNSKEFHKNPFLKNHRGQPKQFIPNNINAMRSTSSSNLQVSNINNNKHELRKNKKQYLNNPRNKFNMDASLAPVPNTQSNDNNNPANHLHSDNYPRESRKNQYLKNHLDNLNVDAATQAGPNPLNISTNYDERSPLSNIRTTNNDITKQVQRVKNEFEKNPLEPAPVYEETGEHHPVDWKFEYKKLNK